MLSYRGIHLDTEVHTDHTVLLLHAFPLSSEMWDTQLSMFEKQGIPALAPDVFGVEGSPEKKSWTFTDYVVETDLLLSSLDIGRVTVVGLSMGGYQAFELWRTFPEKVASLVLCDTKAEHDNEGALAGRRDFIRAVKTGGAQEAIERMLPNVFASDTYLSGTDAVESFKKIVNKQPGEVIAATMQAIASRVDSCDSLETINCPVTFITGKEDKLTPPTLAEAMQRNVPGSVLHIIPKAGHISNMEQPDVFNDLLLDHLEKAGLTP